MIIEETKREKIRIRTGIKALRFVEKIRNAVGRELLKECLKEKETAAEETRNIKERMDYLRINGYSQAGVEELREGDRNVVKEVRERDIQVIYNKIREATYNSRYKYIVTALCLEYLNKTGKRDNQKLIARIRCGNLEEGNRYWLKEEDRKCGLCKLEKGTLKHLIEDCQDLETGELKEETLVEGRADERVAEWVKKIEKKRKERSG
ncbi:uncharacterized protein LOC128882821 [Hylaeus volcanicus]|uniref:uncharacterized protein LOC128882821 n=1 Tax=Hylaeus volcanicus TaxID=313075 RepID=UPI0023B81CB9|nr:uncharacterized protein LOC128882821 [Hylaeus volcanicus]